VLPALVPPLADAVPEAALTVLKFGFLALVYLFLWRVVRVVVQELRAPALVGATASGGGAPEKKRPARADRRGARLRILQPASHQGETYPLGDEITVGRGGGCGIVLPDDGFVSTVHARVFRRGDEVFVEDLGSRNGTFLNGDRIATSTRLRRGDQVQFGQTVAEVTR